MLNTAHAVRGPVGDDVLGEVALASPADVERAVAAAAAAQPRWGALPVAERAACLERAADALAPASEDLARLLALESGKPIAQARSEIDGTIALLRANAVLGRRMSGEVLPTEGNPGTERDIAFTRREPLGVVGAILPFNFPAELFAEKCAAALVAGNACVAKPPLEDPLTVCHIHGALVAAGIPADVMSLVHGDRDTGEALASQPGLDAVSLTGSTDAGVSVAVAGAPHLRRLHLELGGNNAAIVRADADLDLAARELVFGRLMMNGQACSASKRVVVHRDLHDALSERLSGAVSEQVVGDARDEATTIGPLITPAAARRVGDQIAHVVAQGGRLVAGDGRPEGAFLTPCVLDRVPPGADVASDDEIFGPVFCLIPVDGDAQALAVANGSSYGLMASVFTADLTRGLAFAERLRVGGVVLNGTDNYRPPVIPFHGLGRSGDGREGAGFTIEEMTREKTIVLRRARPGPTELLP